MFFFSLLLCTNASHSFVLWNKTLPAMPEDNIQIYDNAPIGEQYQLTSEEDPNFSIHVLDVCSSIWRYTLLESFYFHLLKRELLQFFSADRTEEISLGYFIVLYSSLIAGFAKKDLHIWSGPGKQSLQGRSYREVLLQKPKHCSVIFFTSFCIYIKGHLFSSLGFLPPQVKRREEQRRVFSWEQALLTHSEHYTFKSN